MKFAVLATIIAIAAAQEELDTEDPWEEWRCETVNDCFEGECCALWTEANKNYCAVSMELDETFFCVDGVASDEDPYEEWRCESHAECEDDECCALWEDVGRSYCADPEELDETFQCLA